MSDILSEAELKTVIDDLHKGRVSEWTTCLRALATIDSLKAELVLRDLKEVGYEDTIGDLRHDLDEALDHLKHAIEHAPYGLGDVETCPYCGNHTDSVSEGIDIPHKEDCLYGQAVEYARKHGRLPR